MKQLKALTFALVIVLVMGAGGVQAQDITAEGRAQGRADRIEQYKQEVSDRLSAAEQRRISGVCGAAQTRIDRLQDGIDRVIDNRQRTYGSLTDKLALLSDRLELAGLDTVQLDTYISQVQLDAKAVVSLATEHKQVLADITAMDCESDVDGFQAALTIARTNKADIKLLSQELTSYIQETVRSELESLKLQLAESNPTEDQ